MKQYGNQNNVKTSKIGKIVKHTFYISITAN